MDPHPCISVFGSSRPLGEVAVTLGRALGRAGFSVACGGYGGSMEELSRGASEEGAWVIGVLFRPFGLEGNPYLNETIVTEKIPLRIERLLELGQGYVVLPGGVGTLSELALAIEHVLRGLLPSRPLVLLGQHWRPLISLLDRSPATRGLVRSGTRPSRPSDIVFEARDPAEAASFLQERLCGMPALPKAKPH